jgi:hypothetical protein
MAEIVVSTTIIGQEVHRIVLHDVFWGSVRASHRHHHREVRLVHLRFVTFWPNNYLPERFLICTQ